MLYMLASSLWFGDYIAIIAFIVLLIFAFTPYAYKALKISGPILLLWLFLYFTSLLWYIIWPVLSIVLQIFGYLVLIVLALMSWRLILGLFIGIGAIVAVLTFGALALLIWPIAIFCLFMFVGTSSE